MVLKAPSPNYTNKAPESSPLANIGTPEEQFKQEDYLSLPSGGNLGAIECQSRESGKASERDR
ncbi:hypothetical protein J6590_008818 [Homalodisca vitripennis]|nr:hypothetical protein J6590_008818 [Homalodisca vitripennis]